MKTDLLTYLRSEHKLFIRPLKRCENEECQSRKKIRISVTRWPGYWLNIWPFVCNDHNLPNSIFFANVGFKFWQVSYRISAKTLKFLANLVTLDWLYWCTYRRVPRGVEGGVITTKVSTIEGIERRVRRLETIDRCCKTWAVMAFKVSPSIQQC